jgi:hypothetical protein
VKIVSIKQQGADNCSVKAAVALAVLVGGTMIVAAQSVVAPPLKLIAAPRSPSWAPPPVAIPQELSPPQEAYASFPDPSAAAAAPAAPSACQLRLAKIAAFQPLPVLIGPGECGAVDAVLLATVMLPDQTKVTINPPATLRCPMAEEVAHWVRDDAAAAAIKLGAGLRGLDNFDSYECRGRNRVRGATLSEHGRANALDVRALKLADGRAIGLTDVNVDKEWREGIRAGVCARFSTVLGPGSDGAHEEHIHLDLAERRNNYKLCEWDVREPPAQAQDTVPPPQAASSQDAEAEAAPLLLEPVPLPRPRPLAANGAPSELRMPLQQHQHN